MGFEQEIRLHQRLRVLAYPSGVDVSSSALRFLSAKLRQRRQEIGTRWRRLSAGRQALLTLAHLRNGHPYAQLAAGFGIGTTTAYRYITEPVEALAALAPALTQAVRTASSKAFVLLDGTLLPIDRIAADRPYYCTGVPSRPALRTRAYSVTIKRIIREGTPSACPPGTDPQALSIARGGPAGHQSPHGSPRRKVGGQGSPLQPVPTTQGMASTNSRRGCFSGRPPRAVSQAGAGSSGSSSPHAGRCVGREGAGHLAGTLWTPVRRPS